VGSVSVWEAIFMLVVLKIPMVYLAAVVVWAIRAEPGPDESEPVRAIVPLTPCGWDEWRRRRASRLAGRRRVPPGGRPARRPRVGATA
jgi:hypothetical protein